MVLGWFTGEHSVWPDGPDWYKEAVFFFVVIPLLILSVWFWNPSLVFQLKTGVEDAAVQGMSVVSDDVASIEEDGLVFGENDVEYMNRVYRERTHEVGYCGAVRSDGSVRLRMADTINASETHVVFSWENCGLDLVPEEHRLMVHTHPSGSSSLSETDRETLAGSDFAYSCIQHGLIGSGIGGSGVSGITCYSKGDSVQNEFSELPVAVRE